MEQMVYFHCLAVTIRYMLGKVGHQKSRTKLESRVKKTEHKIKMFIHY